MSTKDTHIPDWLKVPFAGITPAPTQEKGQDLRRLLIHGTRAALLI